MTISSECAFLLLQVEATLVSKHLRQHLKSNNKHCGCCLSNTYHMMAQAFILINSTTLLSRLNKVDIILYILTWENSKVSNSESHLRAVWVPVLFSTASCRPWRILISKLGRWAGCLNSGQIGCLASLKELRQGCHCPISLTIAPNLGVPLNLTRVFLTDLCLTLRTTRV